MLLMRMGIPFASIRTSKFWWRCVSWICKRISYDSIHFGSAISISKFINIGNGKWTFDLCNSNCNNSCKYTITIIKIFSKTKWQCYKFSRKYGKKLKSIIAKKEEIGYRNFTRINRNNKKCWNCYWRNYINYFAN